MAVPIPDSVLPFIAWPVAILVVFLGLALVWDIVIGGTKDAAEQEEKERRLTPHEAAMGRRILDAMDELIDETEEGLPLGRHDLSEDAEMAVNQSERMLRSQRYGPDDEAGQIAMNTLALLTIIAATALVATIGGAVIAAWFTGIVAALTT